MTSYQALIAFGFNPAIAQHILDRASAGVPAAMATLAKAHLAAYCAPPTAAEMPSALATVPTITTDGTKRP